MSLVALQGAKPLTDLSPAAIHDTVAAIVRRGPYGENVAQSLLGRLVQYLVRRVSELFRLFNETPSARPIAIALTALLVVAVVARVIVTSRARDAERREALKRGGRALPIDSMARARSLAAAGQHTDAAHALYVAVVEQLAVQGGIRLHNSKTGGDYARELRARGSPAYTPFRDFNARFEHLIYGVGQCTADDFAELLARASLLFTRERAA